MEMEEQSEKNSRNSVNSSMNSRPDKRFKKSAIGNRAVFKKIFPLLSLFVITQFSRAEKTIKGMLNLRKLTTIRSSNSSLDMQV